MMGGGAPGGGMMMGGGAGMSMGMSSPPNGMNGMTKGGMGGGPSPPIGAVPSFESPRKMVASNGFNGMGGGMGGSMGGGQW